MNSFIVKWKNVRCLTSNLFRLEGLYCSGGFPREVHAQCVLYSSTTKEFIIHDLRSTAQGSDNSNFGKIVDLGYDFDQLKFDDEDTQKDKIKVKKSAKNDKVKRQKIKEPERTIPQEEWYEVKTDENDIKEETQLETEVVNEPLMEKEEKERFKLAPEKNKIFGSIMTKIKSRNYRETHRQIVLEGKRLIYDAIQAGLQPVHIFFSRFDDIRNLNLPDYIKVSQVSYKDLNLWSDVVTSQGVIGVFKMPNLKKSVPCSDAIPLTVICDSIKDPGNLGTILRTVAAVGCEKLILTKGCVDMWELKVLRAGAGAHFRLPIVNNLTWSEIESEVPENIQVVLADNTSEKAKDSVNDQTKTRFRISSEVANSLPLCCYTSFKFDPSEAVLVLGGETSGLSEEAYLFASKRNGSRVYLPMCNGTESLNSSIALGVFTYEYRRQLTSGSNDESFEEKNTNDDSEVDK